MEDDGANEEEDEEEGEGEGEVADVEDELLVSIERVQELDLLLQVGLWVLLLVQPATSSFKSLPPTLLALLQRVLEEADDLMMNISSPTGMQEWARWLTRVIWKARAMMLKRRKGNSRIRAAVVVAYKSVAGGQLLQARTRPTRDLPPKPMVVMLTTAK